MTSKEFLNRLSNLKSNTYGEARREAYIECMYDIRKIYQEENFIVVSEDDLSLDKQILLDFRNALFELSNCTRQILELQKENFELKQKLLKMEQGNND